MYYTYELRSEKDNGFYIGFTKDLKLRFDHRSSFCFGYNRLKSYLTGVKPVRFLFNWGGFNQGVQ